MRRIIIALLMLLPAPALAGQIDYYLKFADEATALAALQKFTGSDTWPLNYCLPDIRVWRASQDVTDAEGNVTHKYLPGYFVLCSFPRVIAALRDDPSVQIVIDRDKGNARRVGGVVKSGVGAQVLQDLRIEPVFAGTDLPYGDMK